MTAIDSDMTSGLADCIELIQFNGCDAERQCVQDWFAGRRIAFTTSGSRSVLLKVNDQYSLKIKGSGRPPDFTITPGVYHATGPAAFRFDYEGGRMADIAIGHDAAHSGAMSYQQASVEYEASRHLASLGYSVAPCIGWGKINHGPEADPSFFAVIRWEHALIRPERSTPEPLRLSLLRSSAETVVELHLIHRIASYFSLAKDPARNTQVLYDLHPTRLISQLTDSPISATLTMLYNLRVQWWALKAFCCLDSEVQRRKFADQVFLAVVPDASEAECRHLETSVVIPMLCGSPIQGYRNHMRVLQGNRISATLLSSFSQILHNTRSREDGSSASAMGVARIELA